MISKVTLILDRKIGIIKELIADVLKIKCSALFTIFENTFYYFIDLELFLFSYSES